MCDIVPWKYLNDAADNRANSVMTFAFVSFVFVNSAREKNLGTCQQRWIGAKRDIAARDTDDIVSGKWWVCIFLFLFNFFFLYLYSVVHVSIVFTSFFGFARHYSSSSTSRISFINNYFVDWLVVLHFM